MSGGYFLRIGDATTCGGKVLTGDSTFLWDGIATARAGDMVSCGNHAGTYKILGGVDGSFDEGVTLAGTLESYSSCPCRARIIPSILDCYSK
ncbi:MULTISPECIES: PAAR domain-containing protein [Erwinia]|uniref:PAAR domain-containing protein n=1 Tax=Erwinia TaxID=551 RepID=UPI0010620277|nr:PAAR domain-containing protein [Erwinia aphidicola]MCP2233600.1 putative Zn-binding protein involved in type VI secretion [Erwinia aphidicola]